MTGLNWLDVSEIPFEALLLLEPFQAAYLTERQPDAAMGTALAANPVVSWYLAQIQPPIQVYIDRCLALADIEPKPNQLREAELNVLDSIQDWLVYLLDPAAYDGLPFLGWPDESLLEMADFTNKVIVDVGAGTGRLAFILAPLADAVYAVEPVAKLRRYLWEKREALNLLNVFPIDGLITRIPLAADFADILVAGHVFGEHPEAEFTEMQRVVRPGGMILLHPGTNAESEDKAHHFLINQGFHFDTFEEPREGIKRKYWLTIEK